MTHTISITETERTATDVKHATRFGTGMTKVITKTGGTDMVKTALLQKMIDSGYVIALAD